MIIAVFVLGVVAAIAAGYAICIAAADMPKGWRKCAREGHDTPYGPWHCVRCGLDLH